MKFLWFLAGLAVGFALLRWEQIRLRLKLKSVLQDLQVRPVSSPSAAIARLAILIDHRQQAYQRLAQQLEIWQQILQAAPISYLQVDEQNQLYWCNLQACQLLSIDQGKQGQSRRLLELVRSYELDQLISEARTAQRPCQKDWRFHPSSADAANLSQEYPLRGHAFPLLAGHVGIFLENRQEAVTLTQERDRWASDVAHELKTPLTSIRLVAEMLHPRVDSSLRTWVGRLVNETVRLGTLVQDLLDLGRIALKLPQELRLKPIDLPVLIQSAWLSLEPLASKKQLRLSYAGPDSLLIQADEARIYRVFLNLFDNSIKYSPANQAVSVRVRVEPTPPLPQNASSSAQIKQVLQIEVMDVGPGFPEQALPHVFERFYRADPARPRRVSVSPSLDRLSNRGNGSHEEHSTTDWYSCSWSTPLDQVDTVPALQPSSGSGLGLAIVQQIIKAHGGSVKASNHLETQGAWLQIFLPWQPAKQLTNYNTAG